MAQTMTDLATRTDRAICKGLRSEAKDCRTVFETATQNALAKGENLWGFSYSINKVGTKSAKDAAAIKGALQGLGASPLDLEKNRISAISYYRETKGKLISILPEEFHKIALNPVSGIVARFDAGFLFSGGEVSYQTPESWQKDGLPAGSGGSLNLVVQAPKASRIQFEVLNLDDQKLQTVSIAACRQKVAATDIPCDAAGIDVKAGIATQFVIDLKAARNLKTEQPAFKFVIKPAGTDSVLLNLAIPFKPRPNYFLFGVTGFLFGGLIAVMVIIGKRKKY